jgi:hypothetical protein
MSFERILERARSLPREEFAKAFASWFLVILDTGEDEIPSSFETMDVSAPRALLAARPAGPLVHEIAKAEGNPYPDRISVGRARNCDIVLRHASVSKLHAHFLPREEGHIDLVDVGSAVGTRVNGRAIALNHPHRIALGFILSIGPVIAKVVDARAAWEVLRTQEYVEESIPPRSSAGLAPAPRPSVPPLSSTGPIPTLRRLGLEPSPAEKSDIRRTEPEAEPVSRRPGSMRRG